MWAVHANTLHLMASCGDIWEHLDLFGTNGPAASIQSVFTAIDCTPAICTQSTVVKVH